MTEYACYLYGVGIGAFNFDEGINCLVVALMENEE